MTTTAPANTEEERGNNSGASISEFSSRSGTACFLEEVLSEKEVNNGDLLPKVNPEIDEMSRLFVDKLLDRMERLSKSNRGNGLIVPLVQDDMIFQTCRLLQCQSHFRSLERPSKVTLAYHYTKDLNLESIRQGGLLTQSDQSSHNIVPMWKRRAAFGDGVYTSKNPFAFRHFGNVGLLVAVIQGRTGRLGRFPSSSDRSDYDTVVGNKRLSRCRRNFRESTIDEAIPDHLSYYDEFVLQNSEQCLPLVRFSSDITSMIDDTSPGNTSLWSYHREMQAIIDRFFNENVRTNPQRFFPSARTRKRTFDFNLQDQTHGTKRPKTDPFHIIPKPPIIYHPNFPPLPFHMPNSSLIPTQFPPLRPFDSKGILSSSAATTGTTEEQKRESANKIPIVPDLFCPNGSSQHSSTNNDILKMNSAPSSSPNTISEKIPHIIPMEDHYISPISMRADRELEIVHEKSPPPLAAELISDLKKEASSTRSLHGNSECIFFP